VEFATVMRLLVQKDDRPLPPAEAKRERESLSKSLAERQQESKVERSRRLSAYQSPPDWRRDTWHELPEAFEFRLVGEATQDGRSIFIIDAILRQGYQSRSRTAKMFPSLKARFWVDQQQHQIVKVEVEVVDDGVWMPDRLQVFASAGLGLLKAWHIDQQVRYSRYNSVPAVARKIYPAEDPDAGSARLNRFAKAASP
jgi:hypothetical protein